MNNNILELSREDDQEIKYDERIIQLLKKAGLYYEERTVKVLVGNVSEEMIMTMNDNRVKERSKIPMVDRTENTDYAVPVWDNRTQKILGYWQNGLSKKEIEELTAVVKLPVFTVAKDDGKFDTLDTQIPLYHLKEYRTWVPADMAEYNIVQYSAWVAKTKAECEMLEASFYWYDEKAESKKKEQEISDKVKAAELVSSFNKERALITAMLLRYKLDLDFSFNITEDQMLLMFKQNLLNQNYKEAYKIYGMKSQLENLLIQMMLKDGLLVNDGDSGAYLTVNENGSTTGTLGETLEAACRNLHHISNADFVHQFIENSPKIVKERWKKAKVKEEATSDTLNFYIMKKKDVLEWLRDHVGGEENQEGGWREEMTRNELAEFAKNYQNLM